jgi:hypothetical protein
MGMRAVFLGNEIYQPPPSYQMAIDILETDGHSIPIVKLTPIGGKEEGKIPCVVYAHGNSSDLGDSLQFLTKMALKFKA